jgi:hypothetical protein
VNSVAQNCPQALDNGTAGEASTNWANSKRDAAPPLASASRASSQGGDTASGAGTWVLTSTMESACTLSAVCARASANRSTELPK